MTSKMRQRAAVALLWALKSPPKCNKCGKTGVLDIHHTDHTGRKDREGKTPKEYLEAILTRATYDLTDGTKLASNLELLCRDCHKGYHKEVDGDSA